jgi:hypothetical protein
VVNASNPNQWCSEQGIKKGWQKKFEEKRSFTRGRLIN